MISFTGYKPGARILYYLLYVILVTGALHLAFSGWRVDDPFITYRYAFNLAHGLGFVYNPGETVLSTTTPLFAIILAAAVPLGIDLPYLANLIGAFGLAVGGLALWDLAHSWNSPLVGWAGLLLYPTFPLLVATLGSETPLFLALCLGSLAAYGRERFQLAAVFAALATLTRPDGLLFSTLLGLDYLAKRGARPPRNALLVYTLITLPWIIFAWLYFGSPVPATMAAKQYQGSMAISQGFAARMPLIFSRFTSLWTLLLEALLASLGVVAIILRRRRWSIILLWAILHFAAYSIFGVSGYVWYYAPLVPGLITAIGLGIFAAYNPLQRRGAGILNKLHGLKGFSRLLPAMLFLLLFSGHVTGLWRLKQGEDQRFQAYRAVGEWLASHTPPSATVGVLEAGIIGYYSNRPLIDFAGLIKPDMAVHLINAGSYSRPAQWAVENYRPEYLVLPSGMFLEVERGYIRRNCQIAVVFPDIGSENSNSLNVYHCKVH